MSLNIILADILILGLLINVILINSVFSSNNYMGDDDLFEKKINFLIKLAHSPSLTACVVNKTDVIWSNGYGYYDVANKKIPNENTVYMAGSITKSVIAIALLQLYEQGLFDLDDDINLYLPFELRNPNYPDENITFRMLMSHQSSLTEPSYSLMYRFFLFDFSYEWLDDFLLPVGSIYDSTVWSDSHPGEEYHYANIGYEVLGYLIEIISNQTLEEYCKYNIFQPLSMMNTSFHVADFSIENIASPYIYRLFRYIPLPHYDVGIKSAGGIRTTLSDLSIYLRMHMNNGIFDNEIILNETLIDLMHTVQYPDSNYCMGWGKITDSDGVVYGGIAGGVIGSAAYMFHREIDDVGLIFFMNSNRVIQIRPFYFESQAFGKIWDLLWSIS